MCSLLSDKEVKIMFMEVLGMSFVGMSVKAITTPTVNEGFIAILKYIVNSTVKENRELSGCSYSGSITEHRAGGMTYSIYIEDDCISTGYLSHDDNNLFLIEASNCILCFDRKGNNVKCDVNRCMKTLPQPQKMSLQRQANTGYPLSIPLCVKGDKDTTFTGKHGESKVNTEFEVIG